MNALLLIQFLFIKEIKKTQTNRPCTISGIVNKESWEKERKNEKNGADMK